jgi:hypothetical protein
MSMSRAVYPSPPAQLIPICERLRNACFAGGRKRPLLRQEGDHTP